MSPVPELPPLHVLSLDPAIGRKIVDVHIWALREGLRRVGIDGLFEGFWPRVVIAGLPLWGAVAGMRTLPPQWGRYGYTWRRDLNAIEHNRFARGVDSNPDWVES